MTSEISVDSKLLQVETESRNRKLVVDFYEKVFVQHDVDGGVTVMADDYIQHNDFVPKRKQGFVSFFKKIFADNPESEGHILRVAADGDLVWVNAFLKSSPADPGMTVVDIFRVADGVIVEHWDVMHNMSGGSIETAPGSESVRH